jgi:hypothetical protein
MTSLGVWLLPVGRWLVAWLTSKWGASLVLIGTLALAASAAAYLSSAHEHQARVPGSVLGTLTPSPAQPSCNILVLGDAPNCTGTVTSIPAQ